MSDIMEIKVHQTPHSKSKYEGLCIIKNFRALRHKEGRNYEESPIFHTGDNKKYEWTLDILLDGYDDDCREYISIRFYIMNERQVDFTELVDLRFAASIIDEDGKKYSTKTSVIDSMEQDVAIFKKFILRKILLAKPKLLPNDELRIAFEISSTIKPTQENQLRILSEIFDAPKYTDFKLIVEKKEFHVHRVILAARSPVFEAMFDSQMRERNEGMVEITDVEASVMEKLLRFVYVGDVGNFEDVADKLLIAAEKYQIDELKQLCEDFLAEQLSLANVYDTLRFADENNAENLKREAIKFFHLNDTQLYAEPDFEAHLNSLSGQLKTDIIRVFISDKL